MTLGAQYALGLLAFFVVGGGILWWTVGTRSGMASRKRALERLAAQHGMTYSQFAGSLGDYRFRLLRAGDTRMFMNVLSGPWNGIPVVVADYWFGGSRPSNPYRMRRRRRKSSSHQYSLAVLGVGARCPRVAIDRQAFPVTVAEHLGLGDIPFESEAFDRLFRVRSTDARFATELVDQRMMAWLLSTGGDYGFEVVGHSALVYCQFVDAAGIPTLLDTAAAFVRHIPDVVTHRAGSLGRPDPADAPSPVAGLAEADAKALREARADGEA
ncbi:MAG: hypothetical protein ACJ77A_05095 [Actinomycetota bacterium]